MVEFFTIATSLPAAPFAALTVLSAGWWVLALVAGIDLDGAAEGAVDGAADAVADGVGAEGPPPLTTMMTRYVPITAWAALFSGWGWIVAFTIGWSLRHPLLAGVPGAVGSYGGLLASAVAAAALARLSARPLAPFFRSQPGRLRSSLVGEIAEITTSRVDRRFGQARLMAGNDDLVLQVRCDRADNALSRGTHALLVGFDPKRDAFVVEPAHDLSNTPEA
jgi:hypothetical protein